MLATAPIGNRRRKFEPNAICAADFRKGLYRAGGVQSRDILALPGITAIRGGATRYVRNAGGVYLPFAGNTPSITDAGLTVGEAATNLNPRYDVSSSSFADVGSTSAPGNTYGAFVGSIVASGGQTWNRRALALGIQPTVVNGTTYTVSAVYFPGTSGKVRAELRNVGNTASSVVSGPVGAPVATDASAGAISGVAVSVLASGLHVLTFQWVPNFSGTLPSGCAGVGPNSAVVGETIEFVRFQMEQAAFTSSLCDGAVNADDLKFPVAGVTTACTFYVDTYAPANLAPDCRLTISDGSTNNRLNYTLGAAGLFMAVTTAGVATGGNVPRVCVAGERLKMLGTVDATGFRAYVNGAQLDVGAGTCPQGMSRVEFGNAAYAAGRRWTAPVNFFAAYGAVTSHADAIARTAL